MLKVIKLIASSIIILSNTCLFAAGSVGTSSAEFLELGVGSRSLGMGEAYTAETNDINTLYYNPAGLGTLKYPVLSLFHQELIEDSRLENIGIAFPMLGGNIGIINTLFWVPSFDKIDANGIKTGEVTYYTGNTTVGYGYDFELFYLGLSAKYIYQRVNTLFLNSFAVDFGFLKGFNMYSPFDAPVKNFHIGISILNLGTRVKNDPLPRMLRLGMSYKLTKWFGFNLDATENLINVSDIYDFTHGFNESFRLNMGAEISYLEIISLRGGYQFNNGNTYSLGLGFNFVIKNVTFTIDSSFSENKVFGPVYSFNVTFKLIPKVVTVDDIKDADYHYNKGIKSYVADDMESALKEFKTTRDYNPYHKKIDRKIKDIEEIMKLRKENEWDERKKEPEDKRKGVKKIDND
ncbi:MAG: PorV/PorQ family protein [Spirochaetes bacterium]|jgi:hypothetical protein|nr:PorV/PorQ family protein [Spirochaetota bacterium]